MSISKDIKDLLITTINALSTTQSVYGYQELNPNGWPCVWVNVDDLQGTFATTSENRRVYGYKVTSIFPLGEDFIKDGSVQREEYAENVLADVVDQIINAIDDNSFLDTINDFSSGDTTGLYVEAADCEWGVIDMEKGKGKAVQISLMIHTDYNIST